MTSTDLRDRLVSRRCALLGAGGIGAATVLAACSSGSDGASDTTTTAAGTSAPASSPAATTSAPASAGSSSSAGGAAIASLSDIPVGGTAAAEVDGENVLLSQPTAGTVEAFSATCPHQGGQVKPDGSKFKCSLHGSEYTVDGTVTLGPSKQDLTPIPVTVSGDDVVAG